MAVMPGPDEWVEPCFICHADVICDDGSEDRGPAVCSSPDCRAEARVLLAPKACRGCDKPGPDCLTRPDGSCPHCGAAAGVDIRSHHHPYRSTTD